MPLVPYDEKPLNRAKDSLNSIEGKSLASFIHTFNGSFQKSQRATKTSAQNRLEKVLSLTRVNSPKTRRGLQKKFQLGTLLNSHLGCTD